jgi:hypothetical protein
MQSERRGEQGWALADADADADRLRTGVTKVRACYDAEFRCVRASNCLAPNDSKSGRDIGLFSVTA